MRSWRACRRSPACTTLSLSCSGMRWSPLAGAGGAPKRAIALASLLALMVAAIMIVGAVAKLGFIADLISKPTMIGYMNGLALTILIGQLPELLRVQVRPA